MTEDNRIRDEIAAFVDRVLMTEAWEESGGEVADRIMRMLTEHGWSPRSSEDNRVPEIRAVLDDATLTTGPAALTRIRDILDSAPPAPRVFLPDDEWQAAVDRASEERAIPEPTEGQNRSNA